MGNACAGPQQKDQAERERRREAALSLGTVRDPGAFPEEAGGSFAAPAGAAPQHDEQYEQQLQLALQESQQQVQVAQPYVGEAGPLVPPADAAAGAPDDDAAMMAAIAASEQEAARMWIHEEEQDAELQAALAASQREMQVLPEAFSGGGAGAARQQPNPFDDGDPFADEPQPQPAPALPPAFDVFAALKEGAMNPSPAKKTPEKVSMKEHGDTVFSDMAAPLQQAVEWIGTTTQRDFSEYTSATDDFERSSQLMMFVSLELHDGVLLCKLLNTLFPGTVADVDESGGEEATPRNFELFNAGCQALGAPMIAADDLQADPEACLPCLNALRVMTPTATATPI